MFALGILLPICFVAGLTGASIPTQWCLLSAVLPFYLWKAGPIYLPHLLGLSFLAWVCLTAAWAQSSSSAVFGIWIAAIWAGAFWFGSTAESLVPLWKGLALGLTISTLFAEAQVFGFTPVLGQPDSGLLYNTTAQGAACALVLLALIAHRLWYYIPFTALGLFLSFSRGAWLILALALIARWIHWFAAVSLLTIGAWVLSYHPSPSDVLRLQIWGIAIHGLPWFGWGPDSFNDVYALFSNKLFHLEYAHNDYLQLWFEFGIGAILGLAGLALALACPGPERSVLGAAAILATFYFPLYSPLTAFIALAAAGHLARSWPELRWAGLDRGLALLSRHHLAQSLTYRPWRSAVPLESRT